jgi:hypothetical protein
MKENDPYTGEVEEQSAEVIPLKDKMLLMIEREGDKKIEFWLTERLNSLAYCQVRFKSEDTIELEYFHAIQKEKKYGARIYAESITYLTDHYPGIKTISANFINPRAIKIAAATIPQGWSGSFYEGDPLSDPEAVPLTVEQALASQPDPSDPNGFGIFFTLQKQA